MSNGEFKTVNDAPARRFQRREGDWYQESANNSIIILGSDRAIPSGPAGVDDGLGAYAPQNNGANAGTVMLIAGRKDLKNGNPDINNDASTFYLSSRTNCDSNLGLESIGVSGSFDGSAAAILKSSNLRLVFRDSLKIAIDDASNYLYFDNQKININIGTNVNIEATSNGESVTINVGKSHIKVEDSTVTIEGATIKLGDNASAQHAVLGDVFKTMFNAHIHPSPAGPTGQPTPIFDPSMLSTKTVIE